MRVFYGGEMFVVQNVQFDLIGQTYCAWIKQYRVFNFWRRDNGNIGIKTKDLWIYASTFTPHISKMISDGKNTNEICNEISANIFNYIDYAFNNKNTDWIRYVSGEENILIDRIQEEDISQSLNINDNEKKYIKIFNAY